MNIQYRPISLNEVDKINEIDASHYIAKAWREANGIKQLIDINYNDTTWPNGYAHHYDSLINTIKHNGIAIGAFDEQQKMLGFITINAEIFGEKIKYVLLDQLFITRNQRGKGIGRKLFSYAVTASKKFNSDKILICAGSAEETIAFYYAMDCVMAKEINQSLYLQDPKDLQMEYTLNPQLF